MRKVTFKKYIPIAYEVGTRVKIPGTGCFDADFVHEGWFHQWAPYQDGQDAGTMGIIELADGSLTEAMPSNMKFVEPYQEPENNPDLKHRYDATTDQGYLLQVLRANGDFGNFNFERWPAFNKVSALKLQDEMVKACSFFTVEPTIVSNHHILFLQKGCENIIQFDGNNGRFSIYGSSKMIPANLSVRHIFEDYFNLL